MGDHPLILEVRADLRIPPDRSTDIWHRDQWERDRDEELSPGATDEWLAAYRQSTQMSRRQALVKELTVLLTTLAGYTFFTYDGDQSWFVPLDPSHAGAASVWGQNSYSAPGAVAAGERFAEAVGEPAPLVPRTKRGQLGQDAWVISEPHRMELPDDLSILLDLYFALEPGRKEAFYAASHLWVQCHSLTSKAPSLSLVAAASAVETLVRCDEPGGAPSCPWCQTPESFEYCVKCHAPRYRLTSAFRNFFVTYGGPSLGNFANRLYAFRSRISHAGSLLRKEFFDSGFNKGVEDEQMLFGIDVPRLARAAIVNWLRTQASKPESE